MVLWSSSQKYSEAYLRVCRNQETNHQNLHCERPKLRTWNVGNSPVQQKTTEPVHRTHYKNLHYNKQKGQVAYHIKKTTKSVYLLQRLVYSMQMSRGPHIHHLLSFFFLLLSHMHTSVLKGNLTQTSHPLNPLNKPINSWCGRHKMMMGMGIWPDFPPVQESALWLFCCKHQQRAAEHNSNLFPYNGRHWLE